MSLKEKLASDIKDAMRAQDKPRLTALRFISSKIKQIEVDERIELDDERVLAVLNKIAKQHKESIEKFENRPDLIKQEEYGLSIIANYLPTPLSEKEIDDLITQAFKDLNTQNKSDMGKIMAYLKPKMHGRVDMANVSRIIQSKLI